VDAFSPQHHVLGHGFPFSQYTLNGPNVLTEDQEQDMSAHGSGMVDPGFKEDPSAGIFSGELGNPL
jgi:hypothetical protein